MDSEQCLTFPGGAGASAAKKLPSGAARLLKHSWTAASWVLPNFSHGGDHTMLGQMGQGLHLVCRNKRPHMGFYGNDLQAPAPLPNNQWSHLAFVYNAKKRRQRIFVDGVEVASRSAAPLRCRGDVWQGAWYDRNVSRAWSGSFGPGKLVPECWDAARLRQDMRETETTARKKFPRATAQAEAARKAAETEERELKAAGFLTFPGGAGASAAKKLPSGAARLLKHSWTAASWVFPIFSHSGDHTMLGQMGQGLHLVCRNKRPHMGFYGNDLQAPAPLPNNQWSHLAFVYNAKKRRQRIFVDGVEVASRSAAPLRCRGDVWQGAWYDRNVSRAWSGSFGPGKLVPECWDAARLRREMRETKAAAECHRERAVVAAAETEAKEVAAELKRGIDQYGDSFRSLRLPTCQLSRQQSGEIVAAWTDPRRRGGDVSETVLPEYRAAARAIIVRAAVLGDCNSRRFMEHCQSNLARRPLRRTFEQLLLLAVRKAYNLSSDAAARRQHSDVHEVEAGHILGHATKLYVSLNGHQAPLFCAALRTLLETEDDTYSIRVMLALMVRAGKRCSSTKVLAFSTLMERSAQAAAAATARGARRTKEAGGGDNDEDASSSSSSFLTPLARAQVRLRGKLITLVDRIKTDAFNTTFLEPAKLFYGEDADIDVHGFNFYAAVLAATLGVRLARQPHMSDWCANGLVSFLDRGVDKDLGRLWDDANFGKSYLAVRGRRQGRHGNVRFGTFVFPTQAPKLMANAALDVSPHAAPQRRELAKYLEQFAHYLSADFLLERLAMALVREMLEGNKDVGRIFDKLVAKGVVDPLPISSDEDGDGDGDQGTPEMPQDIRFWIWDTETHDDRAVFVPEHAVLLLRAIGGILKEPDLDLSARLDAAEEGPVVPPMPPMDAVRLAAQASAERLSRE